MTDQSETTQGASLIVGVLVILAIALLVAGGLAVTSSATGFALLAAALVAGVFARMVQASAHHRELMEGLGERKSRGGAQR
jgi:VIT1/CCC1 family predicted Fe2+/Mn2+ transporter